jgi:hypothetical protein
MGCLAIASRTASGTGVGPGIIKNSRDFNVVMCPRGNSVARQKGEADEQDKPFASPVSKEADDTLR